MIPHYSFYVTTNFKLTLKSDFYDALIDKRKCDMK